MMGIHRNRRNISLFTVLLFILLLSSGCKKKDSDRLNSVGSESSENSSYSYSDTAESENADIISSSSSSNSSATKPKGSSKATSTRSDSKPNNDKVDTAEDIFDDNKKEST